VFSFQPRIYHREQGLRESNLPLLRYYSAVPKPRNERQALEEERAALRKQVAAHKNELEIAVSMNKARRERPDREHAQSSRSRSRR